MTFLKPSTVITNTLLPIRQVVIRPVDGASPLVTFSGECEASFTEILGDDVVIDSSLPMLTLEYATTSADITAHEDVRIAYDAMLFSVRVPASGRLFITKNCRVLDIDQIDAVAVPIDV